VFGWKLFFLSDLFFMQADFHYLVNGIGVLRLFWVNKLTIFVTIIETKNTGHALISKLLMQVVNA